MTSKAFIKWFIKSEEKTCTLNEAGEVEPRQLICEGHLSHVWSETLKYAQNKKVLLLKLPPHTSELLQSLDVAAFKSLKDIWGSALFRRLKLKRTKLSKAKFAELISTKEVWGTAFCKKNIKNAFRKCDIFPLDPAQYPTHRFSLPAMQKHIKWFENGRPKLTRQEIDKAVSEPKSPGKSVNITDLPENKSVVLSDSSEINSAGVMYNGRKGKFLTYFVLDDNPRDTERIDQYNQSINSTPTSIISKTFQDLCSEKLKNV